MPKARDLKAIVKRQEEILKSINALCINWMARVQEITARGQQEILELMQEYQRNTYKISEELNENTKATSKRNS